MNGAANPTQLEESLPAVRQLEVERIGQMVKLICITRSNLNLYSFEHAVAQRNLRETFDAISRILEEKGKVSLDIHKTTLLFESLAIEERNPMVEKIAQDFRNLHVSGVTFHRGLTLKDLAVFFRLLTIKREVMDEHGGAKKLLDDAGVEHIGINQARYVRLEEDQKVVSKAAQVTEGPSPGGEAIEKEFLRQLWDALMKKEVDREWLLEEIRTDPSRAASQIVALLKYYDDQEVLESQEKRQEALDSLLNSIRNLGGRLAERDSTEESGKDQKTVAQSLLVLEQELKSRSAGLKTSQAASRFIEEITNTVTAFIDNLQSDQIVKEYLKDEKGLKRTEQLLRKVLKRGSPEQIMPRLQHLLVEKGLTEKDFEALIDQISPRAKAERKRRPVRHRAPAPLVEKIDKALTQKLEKLGDKEGTLNYLTGVFQSEVREKVKEVTEEKLKLAAALERVDRVMSAAGLSLLVLDEEGSCVMATRNARALLGPDLEEKLDPGLMDFLTSGEVNSLPARESFLGRQPEGIRERCHRLLSALDHPIMDETGKLMGLVLKVKPAV